MVVFGKFKVRQSIRSVPRRIVPPCNFNPEQPNGTLHAHLFDVLPINNIDERTMATLNLSTNGPSISRSYQSIVNAPAPSGAPANSRTYGQWAVFSVSAPLLNAFQQNSGGQESVLKVQSTGGKCLWLERHKSFELTLSQKVN